MPTTASSIRLPFKEAVDYFRQKVDVPAAHWTTLMDQAHVRGFAVAGATDRALIADFRAAIDKAIDQGTGFKAFQGEFDAIVKKHGWVHHGHPQWRARVIYESNMRTAFAAGRYAQATKPDVLAAFPYWEWVHTPVQHPRPQHVAWNGMILRADDPFWDTHYPPCGFGCMCIVASRSDRDLRRRGRSGPDPTPKIEWRDYVNKTTGVVVKVPTGVDPGWAYNPGKAWLEGAKAPLSAPKLTPIGAEPPVLALPGEAAVSPATLRAFLAKPAGSIQVGRIGPAVKRALDTDLDAALLSKTSMVKQVGQHADVKPETYQGIETLLSAPEAILDDGPLHVRLLGRWNDRAITAVVKRTKDGAEIYVKSFHIARETSIIQFVAKDTLLYGDVSALLEWVGEQERKRAR